MTGFLFQGEGTIGVEHCGEEYLLTVSEERVVISLKDRKQSYTVGLEDGRIVNPDDSRYAHVCGLQGFGLGWGDYCPGCDPAVTRDPVERKLVSVLEQLAKENLNGDHGIHLKFLEE